MARKGSEYHFIIEAFTPDTLPMARLAEYLSDLSSLIGEKPFVHFVKLREGSTDVVHRVDYEAIPKVNLRLSAVRRGLGEPEAQRAFRQLNHRLASDNAVGRIEDESRAEVIRFPGRDTAIMEPIWQRDDLDGELIRIGGATDDVHVHLRGVSGQIYNCRTKKHIAREMGQYLYGPLLRVHGRGKWFRDDDGRWELDDFAIESFEQLKSTALGDLVDEIRKTPSGLDGIDDPIGELGRIRRGKDPTN